MLANWNFAGNYLTRALSYTNKMLGAVGFVDGVKKHTVRYALMLVLAVAVVSISLLLYFLTNAGDFGRGLVNLTFLIVYPLLSWAVAREKGRHQIVWSMATLLIVFLDIRLMPLCFLIVVFLPYDSFRRIHINF